MRILVVEDDPDFGAALQRALESQGALVRRVPDAESAYRAVHRHEFDLAVVDWLLVKPFHLAELMARIRALLRRPAPRAGPVLELGPLALNVERRQATLAGSTLDLTLGECLILETLLLHQPGAAPRGALADALASVDGAGTPASIETHMSRRGEPRHQRGAPQQRRRDQKCHV